MRAIVRIRTQPYYRHEAFIGGLKKTGHSISSGFEGNPNNNDLLVIWNRYGHNHQFALEYEKYGANIIVVENGFYGKDEQDRQYYSIARNGHNGSGTWYIGDIGRLNNLNIKFKPWRSKGEYILVCPQRGIGPPNFSMPRTWPEDVSRRLSKLTDREIRIRRHPGNKPAGMPLETDLSDAWAVIVWSSNCATEALIKGIPVFYEAPHIVTRLACNKSIKDIENPKYLDRVPAFIQMSWAQWSVDEIEQGLPFEYLLR